MSEIFIWFSRSMLDFRTRVHKHHISCLSQGRLMSSDMGVSRSSRLRTEGTLNSNSIKIDIELVLVYC